MSEKSQDILKPSGLEEDAFKEPSSGFADEKPIKTTGTTCDAFSARYESRHVFVKRLKPQHASNPRYRAAFQKEYELGVSLRHNSIPQYIKCTGDSLIIEFVDGKTLHQMIEEDDSRLRIEANIEKWAGQLLDVLEFLHNKNVMHCDIKTDNIMITNDTRNLMFIDFDKAYTASQDLTPGTPLNYGSKEEQLTKRQMDIRGIRNILEKLLIYAASDTLKERIEKVVAACGAPEVTMPELLEIWERNPVFSDKRPERIKRYIGLSLGAIILIGLLVIIWSYFMKEPPEVIQTKNPIDIEYSEITIPEEEQVISDIEEKKEEKKPALPEWDSLLVTDVEPLNELLDRISAEIKANRISHENVAYIIMDISNEMNAFNKDVLDKYSTKFPELNQDKIMSGIYDSEPIKLMVKRRDSILQELLEIQESNDTGV